jgi:hypothetical protein
MFIHLHLKPIGIPLPKDLYKLLMRNNIKVNITMRIDARISQFQLNKKILQTPKNMFESLASFLEFFSFCCLDTDFFTLLSHKVSNSLLRVTIIRSK